LRDGAKLVFILDFLCGSAGISAKKVDDLIQ